MARKLVTEGTLTLAPTGGRLPELPWVPPAPDGPTRSRLFPGGAVAMAPLIVVDRLMGWDDPAGFGWAAHTGGHLFVLAALLLLGASVRASGGSPQGAAVAVVLAGTAWPVWQISRHGGAEPVVALLLAVFLWARSSGAAALQAFACISLPWVHPTGCLLAPVLACSEFVGGGEPGSRAVAAQGRSARAGILLAGSLASLAGVVVVWNSLYHGNWWGGGYATAVRGQGFFATPPWLVLVDYLGQGFLLAPLPLAFGTIGALAKGHAGRRQVVTPLFIAAAYLALFALFSTPAGQEPARRLSVVYLPVALTAGRTWDRLPLRGLAAGGTMLLGTAIGCYWFSLRETHYYPRGDGSFDPLVLWLTLARAGRPAWEYLVPVGALVLLGLASLWRLARLRSGAAGRATERGNA